jgi:hypothetical protein
MDPGIQRRFSRDDGRANPYTACENVSSKE